ncbi:hypothetical protein HG15A2_36380 [Adhaeretor mobilis]|uniref:Uncharacterized protein n=1 Tax=Adhaeretor mobilis TaxID=1930276 RepID=A0A517MZI7_9BACT|nr:hypothetical protein HG15A2_36380 [Adhaeretor mobilis]
MSRVGIGCTAGSQFLPLLHWPDLNWLTIHKHIERIAVSHAMTLPLSTWGCGLT